jgi:hypothetical protein
MDGVLKNASIVLGLVSTLLTVFVATTSYSINRAMSKLQSQNAALDGELKKATLTNTTYDAAARVVADFGVFNAREFAANYREQKVLVWWGDNETRDQFEQYVNSWTTGNRLMTGASASGLFLRQVVWLRLTNLGKTPALNPRLLVKYRDFDNQAGGTAEPYDQMQTARPGWMDKEVTLSSLMESGADTHSMRTHVLVPLAHVAGGNKYFGRVFVPVQVVWHDDRLNKPGRLEINVAGESMIRNALGSAVLGRSIQ